MRQALERTLPHAVDAERAILGAILVNNDSFYAVSSLLRSGDFYLETHRVIFRTIVELLDRSMVVDLVTLQEELKRKAQLEAVGGIAYAASLMDGIPHLVSVEHYVEIVRKKATLRALIQSANKIMADCFDASDEVEEIVERAEQSILDLSQSRLRGGFVSLRDMQLSTTQLVEKLYQDRELITGVASGFRDLDRLTSGFQKGDLVIIAARPSMGKAQPVSCNVLTPRGFRRLGAVSVGDMVIGRDGKPKRVTGVFPQGSKRVFLIRTSDGCVTRCCADHLWETASRAEQRRGVSSVKPLSELIETLYVRGEPSRLNHRLPVASPVEFDCLGKLPLSPYLVGCLIGDDGLSAGSIRFSKPEWDVLEKVERLLPAEDELSLLENFGDVWIRRKRRNNEVSETKKALVALGLDGSLSTNKFIPRIYLHSTVAERIQLLQGILDTDGHVVESGQLVEYSTSSNQLGLDVCYLVRSLGGLISIGEPRQPQYSHNGEVRRGEMSYRFRFYFDEIVPVSSEKHLSKWTGVKKRYYRSLESVEPDGVEECVCIAVDSADGLYVTDDFIVTHNTAIALNIAQHAAFRSGLPVGMFSLEMSKEQLMLRLLCAEARVDAHKLRTGYLSKQDFSKLIEAIGVCAGVPMYIEDSSQMTVMEMRGKARRLQAERGLGLLIVDYLQLMSGSIKTENRVQEISTISRGLKALAKELSLPVIALSQLSRAPEQRTGDHKPMLSDLRESGSIEQDADTVMFIYREEVYSPTEENAGLAEVILAKQRNGPTGIVKLAFLREFTRFESLLDIG
ncbi:MAG: replicative DNA helicase [Acidobacteria bacterium]|nr:replicative DNA helicase [Acidobacteriota bacterium]